MLRVLNDGFLALLISIHGGSSTRWPRYPPATSQQIAETSGLQERLRPRVAGTVVVVGRLVEYEPDGRDTSHLRPSAPPF